MVRDEPGLWRGDDPVPGPVNDERGSLDVRQDRADVDEPQDSPDLGHRLAARKEALESSPPLHEPRIVGPRALQLEVPARPEAAQGRLREYRHLFLGPADR